MIVPVVLMWKDNTRRADTAGLLGYASIKTLALLVEASLFILITYAINQAVLSDTEDKSTRKLVANRTAKRHVIVTLCFIIVLIIGSFIG